MANHQHELLPETLLTQAQQVTAPGNEANTGRKQRPPIERLVGKACYDAAIFGRQRHAA